MEQKQNKKDWKVITNEGMLNDTQININQIAAIVATKANTMLVNTTIKDMNNKIDILNNSIADLVNEFRKQSVDERNSSFKVSRRDKDNAISVKSIDSHITHIISLIHIAEIYKLRTNKEDKYSSQKARQLLGDLNLLTDSNYVSKNLQGSSNIVKKYHFDILYEIKHRLQNPEHFDLNADRCLFWREKCFIPDDGEIQTSIDKLSTLLEVESDLQN